MASGPRKLGLLINATLAGVDELPFRRIMNDDLFVGVPKIIETPKLGDAETTDRRMLERLASYLDGQNSTR